MLTRLIIRLVINAIALAAAAWAVDGIHYEGFASLIVMALIFGLGNAVIRPIIKILSFPVLILTLGLFTFVINALMLLLSGWIAERIGVRFFVNGFFPALWGALIVSVVSILLSIFVRSPEKEAASP